MRNKLMYATLYIALMANVAFCVNWGVNALSDVHNAPIPKCSKVLVIEHNHAYCVTPSKQ